jgi:DNA mismatch repair protein MutS2
MPDRDAFLDAIEKLEFERILSHIAGKCHSLFGRERISALRPSIIPAEISDELQRVREMTSLLGTDDRPPLSELEDIRAALHRAGIDGSVVPAADFLDILNALKTFRGLRSFLLKRKERVPLLASLAEGLHENKLLEFHIDRVVDSEGEVKDGASRQLRSIRREMLEKTGQLRRRMESILKRVSEQDMVMEELVTMRDGRMVLPVKAEYKRQIQGFIHSTSGTGQTVYIEPTETLELNNDIRDLQFAELREVTAILTELTDRLRDDTGAMLQSLTAYADIDSLYARARYAEATPASCPELRKQGPLVLRQARHAVLLLHKNMSQVVPVDISIGDTATTILITGPNAGGKSVTMKTVGLAVLMIQSGIPTPCDEGSLFPVYGNVFVDIGDEQSLENDLSTFSSHVSRLAHIIESAGPASLVLIDEIGTGTDPSEGSALGAALLERLTAIGAHVVATTHHGMLKAFAHEHEGMENAAMEFDMQTLQPTYRFRAGLPGSSYAFEITRRHGMDEGVIDRARELLGTQSNALEQMLAEVERQSQALGIRLRHAEQFEAEAKKMSEEYSARMKDIRSESKEVRRRALEDAQRIIDDARAAVENSIREIREEQASREAIQRAHQRLDEQREQAATALQEVVDVAPAEAPSPGTLTVGDEVFLVDNPKTIGTVLDTPSGEKVNVAFGSMRMQIDVARLRRHAIAEERKPQVSVVRTDAPVGREIDIRGMYGDEALRSIDLFLYQCWNAGIGSVDIIHGKGSGALKMHVHNYLKELPFVESYKIAEWNEGGSGVTKVVFRMD